VQLAFGELGDVFVIGHAAIDHHGGAFPEPGALGETIKHGGERGLVLGIAGEDLVGDREPITIDDETHHNLFAIGALVARMAEFGLAVARTLALEIR